MGTKLSKTDLRPPIVIKTLFNREINAIIKKQLDPERIRIVDLTYDLYPLEQFERFLNSQEFSPLIDQINHPALQLMGRERKWWGRYGTESGSGLGCITGTIPTPSGRTLRHANIFIDSDRELWIVDAMARKIFRPLSGTVVELSFI